MKTRTVTVTFQFPDDATPEDIDALLNYYEQDHRHYAQSYLADEEGEALWGKLAHMPVLARQIATSRRVTLAERLEVARAATPDYSIPA